MNVSIFNKEVFARKFSTGLTLAAAGLIAFGSYYPDFAIWLSLNL